VECSEERLWTPEGRLALGYLRERGLSDKTIRLARLGWTPLARPSPFRGITIPWFGPDGLEMVKLRQPDGCEPRYAEVYRRRTATYPGPPLAILPHGGAVVVVEGELDALLLGQQLDGLAVVITLGSASSRPTPGLLNHLSAASRLFLATDGDAAGDRAATGWGERARRVRPPEPHKDWTEAHQAGVKLRWWWVPRLMADPHDAEERAAIQEHDGGLSREAAEKAAADALRAAGLGVPLALLTEPEEASLGQIRPGPQPDGGYVWIEY
jgi:hypothetical protein